MNKTPLLIFWTALSLGILIVLKSDITIVLSIVFLFVCIFSIPLATFLLHNKTLFAVFLLIGIMRASVATWENPDEKLLNNDAYFINAEMSEIRYSASGRQRTIITIHAINESVLEKKIKAVYVTKVMMPYNIGAQIADSVRFKLPSLPHNPGLWNERSYYLQKSILYNAESILQTPLNFVLAKASLVSNVENLQNNIRENIKSNINGGGANLVEGLLLGDKSALDQEILQNFSKSGVIHVLAVSGLHVGLVAYILFFLTGIIYLKFGWRLLFTTLGLVIYAILTGGAPSVIRAGTMTFLILFSKWIERPTHILNILGASGILLLMFRPLDILTPGFQLSFAAVLGIVVLYPIISEIMNKYLHYLSWYKLFKWCIDLIIVSFAAQLGTFPFTLYHFHVLPLAGLAANLFIIPIISMIVPLGLLISALGAIVPKLTFIWGGVIEFSSWIAFKLAEIFANIDVLYILFQHYSVLSTLSISLMLGVLLFIIIKKYSWSVLFGLLALNILIWEFNMSHKAFNINILDGNRYPVLSISGDSPIIIAPINSRPRKKDINYLIKPALEYLMNDSFDYYGINLKYFENIRIKKSQNLVENESLYLSDSSIVFHINSFDDIEYSHIKIIHDQDSIHIKLSSVNKEEADFNLENGGIGITNEGKRIVGRQGYE